MISDAGSRRGRTRLHYGLIAAFALAVGLGVACSPALAGVQGARDVNDPSPIGMAPPVKPFTNDAARSSGEIVVADNHKGNHNGNKGKNWSNNNNWNKNKNWNNNNNKNWSKNNNNNNWNKNWNKNWSHYNNNWNKNWNNRAYVRNWNHRSYYGQFIGGVVLGSILAASGVGIVPYAPEPNVCWYWADPYMVRGYWDYCYDY